MKAIIALWAFVLCFGIIESSPTSSLDQKQSVNKHVPAPNYQQHVLKSDVNNKNIAINPIRTNQSVPNALNNNKVAPRQTNGYPLTNWQQKQNTNENVVQNWNAQQFNNRGFQYPAGLQQNRNVGANIITPPWNAFQAASISNQPKLNQNVYPFNHNQWIRNQQLQPPGNHQLNNPRRVTQQMSQNRESVAQYHPLQPYLSKIQNQHQIYQINANTPKAPPVQGNIAKTIVLGTPIGKATVVSGQSTNNFINKQVSHSTAYAATNTHPVIPTALTANTNINHVTNGQRTPVSPTKQATGPTKVQSTSTNVEILQYRPEIVTTKEITKAVKTEFSGKDNDLSAIRRALAAAEYAAAAAANAAAGANKAAAVANSAVSEANTAAAIAKRAAADAATAATSAKALMAAAGITNGSNIIPTPVSAPIASLVSVTSSAATSGTGFSNLSDTSSRVPIQKVSQVTLTTSDSDASSTIAAISSTSSATVTKSTNSQSQASLSTVTDKKNPQPISVPTNIAKASSLVQESLGTLPISPSKTTKSSEFITSIEVKPQVNPIISTSNKDHDHSGPSSTSSLNNVEVGLDEAKAEYVAELIAKAIAAAITASRELSPTASTRSPTVIDPNTVTKNLKSSHLVYDGELFHKNDEVVILMNN